MAEAINEKRRIEKRNCGITLNFMRLSLHQPPD